MSFLYINEKTGAWGPLDSFTIGQGASHQKYQATIKSLELSVPPLSKQGEGLVIESVIVHV